MTTKTTLTLPHRTGRLGGGLGGVCGEGVVERSLVRLVAVACVVAGVMLMGGTGAVAAAAPGSDGTGGDPSGDGTGGDKSGTSTKERRFDLSKLRFRASQEDGTPKVGPIPPTLMILPRELLTTPSSNGANGLLTVPGPSGSRGIPVTVSAFDVTGWSLGGQRASEPTIAPDNSQAGAASNDVNPAPSTSQPSTPEPPTISLLPLVPPGVPTGPPITITNPVRELLPVDLDQPLVPQLLPAPLVAVVLAVQELLPFTSIVITPVPDFVVPPYLADVLMHTILADIVVPTFPAGALPSATVRHLMLLSLPAHPQPTRTPGPDDLMPMRMDVDGSQSPQLDFVPMDQQQQPNPPQISDVSPMNDPVAFRAGYSDYLRNAGLAQITAIAVPGAVAILFFTAGGGFIGYRHARAGHVIRPEGIARFLR